LAIKHRSKIREKIEMNLIRSVSWFVILPALIVLPGCGDNGRESGQGSADGLSNPAGGGSIGSRKNVNNRTEEGLKILRLPINAVGPGTLDPAEGATQYDNRCASQIYETLVQYKYLKRPLALEPLLLEELPQVSKDGKTYQFKLKQGVVFQDDPCFPGGKGRELITDDVFYTWKRLADPKLSTKNWWLLSNTIIGLDEYRDQLGDQPFDYDADIKGMQKVNDYEFKIVLNEASPKFRWTLAMFQLSIVPREAVEEYGTRFAVHPVGTGPYMMKESDWVRSKNMLMNRNPNYREELYPTEHMPSDEAAGRTAAAGTRLPLVDRIETIFYSETLPMWLEFRSRKLGFSTVPAAYYDEAFNKRKKNLKPSFEKEGITYQQVPLLDFIFYGFNMEDPVVGGYTEEKRYLRQALSLAIDWDERNHKFENDSCTIYDGMIPPGLDGYPPNGKIEGAYRGVDLERARELLAKAGFPNGKGLPVINFFTSKANPGPELVKMTADQLGKIGVRINPRLAEFPALMEEVDKKNASMFMFAWLSDYPDAENNLAMFYGPNESPGSNHFNYKNPEYDRLYEQIRTMPPGPERTAIYEQMRDMVIRDAPFIGSLARVRQYLVNPELKNFKATEDFQNWYKYLDVE
jgi:oligopeptide transport system substrate-binding protein